MAKAANPCQAVPILHLEMFDPLVTIHICGRKRQGDEKVRRSFSELSDPLTLVFVFSPVGGGRLHFRLRFSEICTASAIFSTASVQVVIK